MNLTKANLSLRLGRESSRGTGASGPRHWLAAGAVAILLAGLVWGALALQHVTANASATRSLDADHLYNLTNVWTIHLKVTPDQWDAMEPKGGFSPFGGGPRGGGHGTGPGGFGGGSGDRSLAPVFMSQGDADRDGRISPEEFTGLAQSWFAAWDTSRAGKLDESQLRAGLDAVRNPAGSGIATMLLAAEGKRNGVAAAFGIEFEYVHADLEIEGHRLPDVGVRYKGNGTFIEARDSLKRSFKIETDKYVKGQSLGGVKALTLQNNVTDASLMNEVLAYRLYRDAGVPAPRTAYARVFVTVPGKHERRYFGLYSMSEAVDKAFAERHFGTKHGAIFKPVTPSLFTDLGADWAAYNQVYDPKGAVQDEHKAAVMALARFVTQADDTTFAARIGQFIDLPEFARFMVVMVYLSDLDGILGPGQNLYLHLHPKSPHFRFIPWDQDRSWGQFNRASQEQRDRLSIHRPWQGENFFLERMFKVEAFKQLYLARLDEFARTIFTPKRIAQQVDQIAAVIRPAVQEESETKLARFDQVVAGELVGGPGPFGGGQTKPIKPFTVARTASVVEQLAGTSEGLSPGGGFPGGPGGSGLGSMFARPLFQALDDNKDSSVTRDEFTQGLVRLFQAWNSDQSGDVTLAQLRSGIQKDLPPSAPGFPRAGAGPRGPGRGPGSPGGPGGRGTSLAIAGTKDPALFMSERFGMRAFSTKVSNGKYLAKLYFAETYEGITGPGQRVFSFEVQGHAFQDFDVWVKAGGRNRAYIETVPVEVTDGEFRIAFTAQVENPAIKAIEIIPQAPTETAVGSSAATIRIKAGVSTPFTDSSGRVWQPDTGFEGGMTSQIPWDGGAGGPPEAGPGFGPGGR